METTNITSEPKKRGLLGWECPKCGRVLSPFIAVCPCFRDSNLGIPKPIHPNISDHDVYQYNITCS